MTEFYPIPYQKLLLSPTARWISIFPNKPYIQNLKTNKNTSRTDAINLLSFLKTLDSKSRFSPNNQSRIPGSKETEGEKKIRWHPPSLLEPPVPPRSRQRRRRPRRGFKEAMTNGEPSHQIQEREKNKWNRWKTPRKAGHCDWGKGHLEEDETLGLWSSVLSKPMVMAPFWSLQIRSFFSPFCFHTPLPPRRTAKMASLVMRVSPEQQTLLVS